MEGTDSGFVHALIDCLDSVGLKDLRTGVGGEWTDLHCYRPSGAMAVPELLSIQPLMIPRVSRYMNLVPFSEIVPLRVFLFCSSKNRRKVCP